MIRERAGLLLSVAISGANTHDSQALQPLVRAIPPIRSRRGRRRRKPGKLHGDKGYDYDHLCRWLRERGIVHCLARKGVESSKRLGRHRRQVERTMAWLAGRRRLHRRYRPTTHRRLAKDYERGRAGPEAMVYRAAIGQMARRLARGRDAVRRRAWTGQDLVS